MRWLRLLTTAAQAEGILLRRQGASIGRAAVLGAAAAGFGLAMLILLHVAGWLWLEEREGPVVASLLLALVDGVLAVGLLLASRRQEDPVAKEAMAVRDQSLALLTTPAAARPAWEGLALDLGGLLIQQLRRRQRG
ncbi:MAG: hypothetical protein K5Q68_03850 [Roseococcus sp.]|nr:hypothetical protein [Roseococcus sp.]